jgi:hypothetical protein
MLLKSLQTIDPTGSADKHHVMVLYIEQDDSKPRNVPSLQALVVLIGLSALFYLAYGGGLDFRVFTEPVDPEDVFLFAEPRPLSLGVLTGR